MESLAGWAGYCLCSGLRAAGSHDCVFSDVVRGQRVVSARRTSTRNAGGHGSGIRAVDANRWGHRRHCELPPVAEHRDFLGYQFPRGRSVLRRRVFAASRTASRIAVPAFGRRLPVRGGCVGCGELHCSSGSALTLVDRLDSSGRLHQGKLELVYRRFGGAVVRHAFSTDPRDAVDEGARGTVRARWPGENSVAAMARYRTRWRTGIIRASRERGSGTGNRFCIEPGTKPRAILPALSAHDLGGGAARDGGGDMGSAGAGHGRDDDAETLSGGFAPFGNAAIPDVYRFVDRLEPGGADYRTGKQRTRTADD